MNGVRGQASRVVFEFTPARCVSSEQQVLVKTETATTSYEAGKLLPTSEGKKHDQVTFSPGSWHV